jgi:hypothetical protein
LRPKVNGAWNLHELTQGDSLDFFVMFSSAASVLGSPGQGSYSAANAFLDALCHYRRQLGQNALSINWGAWADAGMAANLSTQNRERMRNRGLGIISSADGFQALDELLAAGSTQVVFPPTGGSMFNHCPSPPCRRCYRMSQVSRRRRARLLRPNAVPRFWRRSQRFLKTTGFRESSHLWNVYPRRRWDSLPVGPLIRYSLCAIWDSIR